MNYAAHFLLLGMLCLPFSAESAMYKCADSTGKMAYQDKPCASATKTQKIMMTSSDKMELDPVLASIKLGSTGDMLEKMEAWCVAKAPSTVSAIKQARMAWHQRHESLLAKGAHILQTRLSYDERLKLAVQSRLANNEIYAKLENASQSECMQWCEGMPAKMRDPQIDMTAHPLLVKTIMGYTDH
ncbi:MAG: DUF4124 domain-containing protein [Gallionella sp.]|nr:DUF4124 domain-containing protein [Gallionella sp.]MDD4959272.1 DUF4124 domain-containing protein [Gallionella sp.]